MKKFYKHFFKCLLFILIFLMVFGFSAFSKVKSLVGDNPFSTLTLQGSSTTETLADDEFTEQFVDISYIKEDGNIDTRQIVIYKPADKQGDLPLIFVPHYAIEKNSSDFVAYIKNGWATASTNDFKNDYNGVLETDDLVFNNAALYTLRHMDGIDKERIAVVGGSAGAYITLMLSELQMGTVASIANSPIANTYFNMHEYFPVCDEINKNSGLFDFAMPIQGIVSKPFQSINDIIGDDYARWEAVSPISMANAISSPLVAVHYTSDVLVPIDQITHKYTYENNDGTLPEGFNASLGSSYPGILSSTLEEMADPNEIIVNKSSFQNNAVEGDLPYSDKRLTINVIDDGPTTAKGGHRNPDATGGYDSTTYLIEMMNRTLADTEELVPAKLILLLDRYAGNSKTLPAHKGINNTVYGSLEIYKQEIIEELDTWVGNHSIDNLDSVMKITIAKSGNDAKYTAIWNEIKSRL